MIPENVKNKCPRPNLVVKQTCWRVCPFRDNTIRSVAEINALTLAQQELPAELPAVKLRKAALVMAPFVFKGSNLRFRPASGPLIADKGIEKRPCLGHSYLPIMNFDKSFTK